MKTPLVPVSWGELIDKITILEIKARHIVHEPAASNVRTELSMLNAIAQALPSDSALAELRSRLSQVNASLWQIEDDIRQKDMDGSFDAGFIELARAVYRNNDVRARLKKEINTRLGSELVEEKSYKDFGGQPN